SWRRSRTVAPMKTSFACSRSTSAGARDAGWPRAGERSDALAPLVSEIVRRRDREVQRVHGRRNAERGVFGHERGWIRNQQVDLRKKILVLDNVPVETRHGRAHPCQGVRLIEYFQRL